MRREHCAQHGNRDPCRGRQSQHAQTEDLKEQIGNPGLTRDLSELTPREADVLRLIARGLGNYEIGEKLFVSQATVKTHVAHILDKLHVENRVQAVVAAYESRLVTPGEVA